MDSEHRHELKTNELAQWINNLPEFIKTHGFQILGVILVIAAIISYFVFKNTNQQASQKRQVSMTNEIQQIEQKKAEVVQSAISGNVIAKPGFSAIASDLAETAEKAKKPAHAAMALIHTAQAFRTELHFTPEIDQETIKSNIEQAKQAYEKAIIEAKDNQALIAMAKYGLALCEEELRNFDKAAEMLKEIAENEEFAGTIFPEQARFRLDVMEDHKKEFTYVQAPKKPAVSAPEGFDKSAAEALERGDIHMEGLTPEDKKDETKAQPEEKTENAAEPEKTPEPVKEETKSEEKTQTETNTEDKTKTENSEVYPVGPQPPSDTENTDTE